MSRLRKLWMIVAVLALVATSCGGDDSSSDTTTTTAPSGSGDTTTTTAAPATTTTASTAPPAPDKITVLTDFLLFGYHSPLFAGVAEGFFADNNLEVTIEGGRGSADGATKIASGAADFGVIDSISSLVASTRGADLRQVAAYMPRHPGGLCYITDRTSIGSYADVEGLTIGAAEGDAYMVALPGLMEAAGADSGAYEFQALDPATTTAALVAGEIDATPCGLPTFASRAAGATSEGLTADFFSFADNGFDVMGFSVVAEGNTVDSNPDLVARFVDAWARSVIWSVQNPDAAVADFLAANPDKTEAIEILNLTNVFPLLEGTEGYFKYDFSVVDKTIQFIQDAYGESLDSGIFTNEFVDQLPAELIAGNLP